MVESVRFQHTPQYAGDHKASSAVLHIASRAASAMEQDISPEENPDYLALLDPDSWSMASVEQADLEAAVVFADQEAWNVLGAISSTVP